MEPEPEFAVRPLPRTKLPAEPFAAEVEGAVKDWSPGAPVVLYKINSAQQDCPHAANKITADDKKFFNIKRSSQKLWKVIRHSVLTNGSDDQTNSWCWAE